MAASVCVSEGVILCAAEVRFRYKSDVSFEESAEAHRWSPGSEAALTDGSSEPHPAHAFVA